MTNTILYVIAAVVLTILGYLVFFDKSFNDEKN